ncbi:MAG: GNAT family N-acetyltransferase [Gammaproteobacteria bacterium]|nr:GNAT family N-acetyltransferase [Gammaproteobacteria bacterium]
MAHRGTTITSDPKHPREYPIFRPRPDECPYDLLALDPSQTVDLDTIRVSKHGDRVIAAYKLRRLSAVTYEIERLGVALSYRHQGLGSWLLAHAVGIAESKGGREVVVNSSYCGFFGRLGFEAIADHELRLALQPE